MSSDKKILGPFESVIFPDFDNYEVQAKIDTGAYSGALHCTRIQEEHNGKGPLLKFSPFDHPEIEIVSTDFAVRHVRSSNGERQERYFIKTNITIDGQTYPIILSLADRTEMKWPVLIGRRFLRQNDFLVDVNKLKK